MRLLGTVGIYFASAGFTFLAQEISGAVFNPYEFFQNTGIIGGILMWFMFRNDTSMKGVADAIERLTAAINASDKAQTQSAHRVNRAIAHLYGAMGKPMPEENAGEQ